MLGDLQAEFFARVAVLLPSVLPLIGARLPPISKNDPPRMIRSDNRAGVAGTCARMQTCIIYSCFLLPSVKRNPVQVWSKQSCSSILHEIIIIIIVYHNYIIVYNIV